MLTRGKVFSLAVPIILAQAATATTGVVDTAIMGRFGDKADLAAVAIAANRSDRVAAPRHSAINNGSGGIGKKDDSAMASRKSAETPYGVSAQCSTQSYRRLTGPGRGSESLTLCSPPRRIGPKAART